MPPPRPLALALLFAAVLSPCISFAQTPDAAVACASVPPGKATYVEESIAQLKSVIPDLKGLQTSPDPAACAAVLNHTGPMLADMIAHMPNLISQEEVWELRVTLPYTGGSNNNLNFSTGALSQMSLPTSGIPLTGNELEAKLRELVRIQGKRTHYNYRIHPAEIAGVSIEGLLTEFRSDAHDQPVTGDNAPNWRGFAGLWTILLPDHWQESHFRYLGTQMLQGRLTAVLAFAQVPDRVSMPGSITNPGGGTNHFFLQGILWVDQTTFDLVRIQTDLRKAAHDEVAYYKKLRSSVDFQQIVIPERNLTLTLPANVEVLWERTNSAGIEAHTYSKYRLFAATSRIVSP